MRESKGLLSKVPSDKDPLFGITVGISRRNGLRRGGVFLVEGGLLDATVVIGAELMDPVNLIMTGEEGGVPTGITNQERFTSTQ